MLRRPSTDCSTNCARRPPSDLTPGRPVPHGRRAQCGVVAGRCVVHLADRGTRLVRRGQGTGTLVVDHRRPTSQLRDGGRRRAVCRVRGLARRAGRGTSLLRLPARHGRSQPVPSARGAAGAVPTRAGAVRRCQGTTAPTARPRGPQDHTNTVRRGDPLGRRHARFDFFRVGSAGHSRRHTDRADLRPR